MPSCLIYHVAVAKCDEPRRRGSKSLLATQPWQGVATPSWQRIFTCHGAVAGCRYAGVAVISHGAVAEKCYLPRRRGRGSPRRRGSDEPRRRGRENLLATPPWQIVATPAWQR